MADQDTTQAPTDEANDGKIPAALLKLVQRPATDKKGKVVMAGTGEKATPQLRAIKAAEVFGWKEYADRVAVVTADGQKFTGQK